MDNSQKIKRGINLITRLLNEYKDAVTVLENIRSEMIKGTINPDNTNMEWLQEEIEGCYVDQFVDSTVKGLQNVWHKSMNARYTYRKGW